MGRPVDDGTALYYITYIYIITYLLYTYIAAGRVVGAAIIQRLRGRVRDNIN